MMIRQFRSAYLIQLLLVTTFFVIFYKFLTCSTNERIYPWNDTDFNRYPKAKSVVKNSIHISANIHLKYLQEYNTAMEGWFSREILYALWVISQYQYDTLNIYGGIGEIGVHHGKLTSYLYLLRRYQEQTLFAVDVFDNQALNKDGSGRGQKDMFLKHIRNYAQVSPNEVAMYAGSSLDLNPIFSQDNSAVQLWNEEIVGERGLQIVSVDGGHTSLLTYSDLCLVANSLTDGGVVLVDDITHPGWLGVQDGASRYLAETSKLITDLKLEDEMARTPNQTTIDLSKKIVDATTIKQSTQQKQKCARLVPFLQYFNKLFLTTPKYYPQYIQLMGQLALFANSQRVIGIEYLEYHAMRLTIGSVPVWILNHDFNKTYSDEVFKKYIEPTWLHEVQTIDQRNQRRK